MCGHCSVHAGPIGMTGLKGSSGEEGDTGEKGDSGDQGIAYMHVNMCSCCDPFILCMCAHMQVPWEHLDLKEGVGNKVRI